MDYPKGTRVIVTIDCRPEKNSAGKTGRIVDHVPAAFGMRSPKIELDDGEIIHGYECWWKPYKDPVDSMYL